MSEQNSFERILARLDEADTPVEKTAEESTPTASPQDRMLDIVSSITAKTASEATAGQSPEGNPVDDLTKLANDAQAAEEQHLVKQAQFLGAALADGFMERFAQYDAALADQGVKTAATTAAPNQEQLQQAYTAGVKEAEAKANANYTQGYNDQMQAVHKVASDLHYSGQLLANQVVEDAKASNQQK